VAFIDLFHLSARELLQAVGEGTPKATRRFSNRAEDLTMIAAKALVGIIIVPLSFLAGAGADRGLRLIGFVEDASAGPSKEMSSTTPYVRVVYPPSWSPDHPPEALPATLDLTEPNPMASVEDERRSHRGSRVVDINSASIDEMNRMGAGRIGKAIVRRRPYNSTEDLLRKRVLTRADYERIHDKIAVK
jgi:hypothetical protein